jgi:hypothetical protein
VGVLGCGCEKLHCTAENIAENGGCIRETVSFRPQKISTDRLGEYYWLKAHFRANRTAGRRGVGLESLTYACLIEIAG